jgi:hypothetical protein
MFPGQLLAKFGDIILSQLGSEAGKKLISARQDSSKKFGRDLFEFYEDLGTYVKKCNRLAHIISVSDQIAKMAERSRVGSGAYIFFREEFVGEANSLSAELADLLGRLVERFWPDVLEPYLDGIGLFVGRLPGRHARRRAAIMEIHDERLVQLAKAAYEMDTQALWLLREIATSKIANFDKDQREVWIYYLPHEYSAALPYLWHLYDHPSSKEWKPPQSVIRLSMLHDKDQLQELALMFRRNAEAVEELRARVREALRQYFTIDDLL